MDFPHGHDGLVAMIKQKISLDYQDITRAIRVAFQRKSLFMVKMVSKELSAQDNFKYYVKEGVFARLKAEYPNEFAYFMDHFRSTLYADTLMKDTLSNKRSPFRKDILDMLYPNNNINFIYDSDKMTLVQRAVYAEDVELLLRLTNEGASVAEVPGASKPCPLLDAGRTGRYELMVILVYAYQHGAGWLQKFPDVAARIRRMATPYQSRFLKAYPEKEEDEQWAMNILENAKIPPHLFKSMDFNRLMSDIREGQAIHDRFFKPSTTGAGITLTDDFFRYMKWGQEGGALPSCKK